jgi:hypothetical protein
MDMGLFAKDNEDHKVVFQHMKLVLLMLLSLHFYLKQVMESMENLANIDLQYNKPEKQNRK